MGKISSIQKSGLFGVSLGLDEYHNIDQAPGGALITAENVFIDGDELKPRPGATFLKSHDSEILGISEFINYANEKQILVVTTSNLYHYDEDYNLVHQFRISGGSADYYFETAFNKKLIVSPTFFKKFISDSGGKTWDVYGYFNYQVPIVSDFTYYTEDVPCADSVGDVSVKIAFANNTEYGWWESDLSPAQTLNTAGSYAPNSQESWINIPNPGPGVEKVIVYRTKAGGTTYYKAAEKLVDVSYGAVWDFQSVESDLITEYATPSLTVNLTEWYEDVGIDAPDTAPTLADGGGTGVTGSYGVVYTYCQERGGVVVLESNPSPVASITVTNKTIHATIPAPTDDRVTLIKIYRSTANGARYYFEKSSPVSTLTNIDLNIADALLGLEVENTHTVPLAPRCVAMANNILFSLVGSADGDLLYYSETGTDDSRIEYQPVTNFYKIPTGSSVFIKSVYNSGEARDDLYIFCETAIYKLPRGDKTSPIIKVNSVYGCSSAGSVAVAGEKVIFLSNKNTVCALIGDRVVDISSRAIPKTLSVITRASNSKGEILYGNYYALSISSDFDKAYNHIVVVCDLRKLQEVQQNVINACWVKWFLNAKNLLSRSTGSLVFSNSADTCMYSLTFEKKTDDVEDTAEVLQILRKWRPVNHFGSALTAVKQPVKIWINGRFEKDLTVIPIIDDAVAGESLAGLTGKTFFVMGESVMGDATSESPGKPSALIPRVAGESISFEFSQEEEDNFSSFVSYIFTYKIFERGI